MIIKAIISDFDGTLVDTFEANYQAYKKAFGLCGLHITREDYLSCFGLRFDAFMERMKVQDDIVRNIIRKEKARLYPECFDLLVPNRSLIDFIKKVKLSGVKTAIASTAQIGNLMNVLNYLSLAEMFDGIIAGKDVQNGKPNPEIYLKAMEQLGVLPEETLIFEDTEVGLQAAEASGANYVKVTGVFFDDENSHKCL